MQANENQNVTTIYLYNLVFNENYFIIYYILNYASTVYTLYAYSIYYTVLINSDKHPLRVMIERVLGISIHRFLNGY
jgi:hypothetical protein